MKKAKIILPALVTLLALTGCGGKKLTCTMSQDSMGMEMKNTVNVTFKDDAFDSMNVVMDITVPEEYADSKQELIDTFKESEEDMKVTETKNGIRLEMSSESEYFEELDVDKDTVTYDQLKALFEDEGYTCK